MPGPSTPAKAGLSTPGTGSWRHPAMDTIVHRTKKKGLADIHHIRIAKNLGALVTSFVVTFGLQIWIARSKSNHNQYGYGQPQERHPLWDDVLHIGGYLVNTLRILFCFNILESLYRLMRKEPDFSDLALTPMQRKLLGLDPNVSASAPTGGYITPPRYPKMSPTASSPLSNPGSPYPRSSSPTPTATSHFRSPSPARHTTFGSTSTTSVTDGPMTPSPLRSTYRGGTMAQSLGFSVSSGTTAAASSVFDTPSPVNRTGQGLGLGYGTGQGHVAAGASGVPVGNRWVYEKMGRRGEGLRWTPGRNSLFSPMKGQLN